MLAVALVVCTAIGWPASPPFPAWIAILSGPCVGLLLFVSLARRGFPLHRLRGRPACRFRRRARSITLSSVEEELVWRGLVLGGLSVLVGVPVAAGVSILGFALSHRRLLGRRCATHLVTGAGFTSVVLLTDNLAAGIGAHVTYNLLVLAAVESTRVAGVRAIGMQGSTPLLAVARSPTPPAAELIDVAKSYGETIALGGLTVELREAEVLALLGANGAGKSTAVQIMLGLRRPDTGAARLFGRDPRDPQSRAAVGSTPQDLSFPTTLRVAEVVAFVAAHFFDPLPTDEVFDRFGLSHLARRQTGGLSGGERRRLALALAFVGRPRAVLLDEPTTGLDVESRRTLWETIREQAAAGCSILLTTHYLEEAEALATRIVVLRKGRVLASGTAAELRAAGGRQRVRIPATALYALPTGFDATVHDGRATIYTDDPSSIVRSLIDHGVPLRELEIAPHSLDEAFLNLTGEERRE